MLASAPKVFASHLNSVFFSDAGLFLTSPLSHWSIRNLVHRFLDVAFPGDDSRIRQGHAHHNMAVLLRLAFNLLRRRNSVQIGISAKRKRAGWKTDYLLKVLSQQYAYALHPPPKLCIIRTYRVNQPRLLKIASYSSPELCHINPSLLQLHRRSECLEDVSELSKFSRPFSPYSS